MPKNSKILMDATLRAAVQAVPSVNALAKQAGVAQSSLSTFARGASLDLHTASLVAQALGLELKAGRRKRRA
jgi:DNA-binding phage protein